MNRRSAAVTSACIGMAVGTCAYMLSGPSRSIKRKTRKLRKNTCKALRGAGNFFSSVSDMVG